MRTSDTIAALAAALAAFQGGLEQPDKNRTVKVKGTTKDGKAYSYDFKYATFDNILAKARDSLSKNGLSVVQMIGRDENGLVLTTRIGHKDGEFIEDTMPVLVGSDKSPQAIGSAISYTKRYSYCAALGIVAEEDDDGNAAEGNQVEVQGRKNGVKTASPKAPPPKPDTPAPWEAKLGAIRKAFSEAPTRVALEALAAEHKADIAAMPEQAQVSAREAYGARRADLSEAAA